MGTNADTEKLKELYQSLDRLKASGEDVIAEIRREINNIELQYLKDNLFPEIMKIIGERISWLRCTIDMSLQFDGDKQIDYSFCKSGSIVFVRDKYECNGHDENAIEKSGTDSNNQEIIIGTSNRINGHDTSKHSKTHVPRVEFPDGRVFQSNIFSDTYTAVIKGIGAELVDLVGLEHAGVGVVSKTLDAKYAKYQKPIGGGWYVMTNSSTQTKSEDLQAISDELDLNLKINLVPLDGSETLYLPKSTNKESTRTKIQVTFPDGRKICSSKVLEALIEVVKYAGAERVRELRINCCADNLILKTPAPRYEKPFKPVGNGWLCNTCSDTITKFNQITEISQKLNLGIKAKLV